MTTEEKKATINKAIEALNRNSAYEMEAIAFTTGTISGSEYITATIANGPRENDQYLTFDDEWFSTDFDENADRYTAISDKIKLEIKCARHELRPVLKVMGVIWFYTGLCLNTK